MPPMPPRPGSSGPSPLPGVRHVVAVVSGKGGVGKSTVAVNLALALAKSGKKVGVLDCDIYGPSMPTMLGLVHSRPQATPDDKILPLERYGLKVMSMGFMIRPEQAVVWRGPMLGKALEQFLGDVLWGELDVLVLDMPPGTGDVQLSLAQQVPVTGAVVVTTPQDVAFADVRRAIKMMEMTKVPMLGLVENMSVFTCGQCGAEHRIYGDSRIDAHAEAHDLPVLGKLPLDGVTAVAADQGEPIVVAAPDSDMAKGYASLGARVAELIERTDAGDTPAAKFASFFEGPSSS